jgi:hypothetical protein
LRSQREANGDLASLFIHNIGNGPVDSKPGEQQGSGRKKRHHFHRESPDGKRGGEHVIQGLRMEDGKFASTDWTCSALVRRWRWDRVVREGRWPGLWRGAGTRCDRSAEFRVRQRFRAGIRNHADDRGPGRLGRAQAAGIQVQTDAFAKRVLIWPVGASRGLIDDRNLGRVSRSWSLKRRPRNSGMPNRWKYSGETMGLSITGA